MQKPQGYSREMGKRFTFIDLFAGIGGIRIPFDELGGQCVFTSEIDPWAVETYEANFPKDSHKVSGDLTLISTQEIPSHDLLLAGFPCQPFSRAGHQRGFEDTRGTLFFDIERILKFHKPKTFLLENVKGLISHDNKHTFRRILEILDEDYVVSWKVLNAKDFGLPQSRARVYIVGVRRDFTNDLNPFTFPEPTRAETRVGDILESRVPKEFTISDRLWSGHLARKAKHLENGNGWGYRLFNKDSQYTSTISARYGKDGSEALIEQKGKNPRKLTPREAARLQGFPEWFCPSPSKAQAYKQFGNAVPVSVVAAIAKKLVVDFVVESKDSKGERKLVKSIKS
jgi:DNA (cytosine-5)-methyltransferase 1